MGELTLTWVFGTKIPIVWLTYDRSIQNGHNSNSNGMDPVDITILVFLIEVCYEMNHVFFF